MGGKVFRPARLAVPGHVRRRGNAEQTRFANFAADEIGAADSSDAHREVKTFVDQVGCAVGELDVKAKLRIAGEVVGDGRREMPRAERDRAGQTQCAGRLHRARIRRLLRLVQVGEQLQAALMEGATAFGQAQTACCPVQEPGVEMGLEVCYLSRNRGHRDVKPISGAGEASGFDDFDERSDGLKAVDGRELLLRIMQQTIDCNAVYPVVVKDHHVELAPFHGCTT